jgi:S-disulfanyl-L-cysteine oxidoreductase SoxD
MKSPYDRLPSLSSARSALLFLAAVAALAQTSRSVWDGVYTEDQAKRGAAVYSKECAACHGADLNGGESAPALVGGVFLSNWNTLTVGDLFERVRQSMPQDNPGRLSRQQDADVLALMLQANEFPAGKTELDKQTEVLKLIGFKKK